MICWIKFVINENVLSYLTYLIQVKKKLKQREMKKEEL